MKSIALTFSGLIFIVACSSTVPEPEQYLAMTPIEVAHTELASYWVAEPVDFQFSPTNSQPSAWSGSTTIRYLIDSNGHTFDAEIIESTGDRRLETFAHEVVSQSRYRPAAGNLERTPVYTTNEVSFELERVN